MIHSHQQESFMDITILIFALFLIVTFGAAIYGGTKSKSEHGLAEQKLTRWQIGLSAATTGNSGFVVTGAVGIGYSYGAHWILLPLAWMLGDLMYWKIFPQRINELAGRSKTTTLSQLLTFDLHGSSAKCVSVLVAFLVVFLLGIYVSAQWLAGRKFLSGAFNLPDWSALVLFAGTIVVYSAIGGFRGSVYADVVQAFIRLTGTVIALVAVVYVASQNPEVFNGNIQAAGTEFLLFFPNPSLITSIGFVAGWAAAAIGFGLGQPQIVSRYMAGASPTETRAAWWIYIGFLQITWIAMTGFGMLLRGVMPNISDPEAGLSIFMAAHFGPILTGIILADVYATIASTSNGILVAISQVIQHDLVESNSSLSFGKRSRQTLVLGLGLVTIALSFSLPGNVFTVVVGAASMLGAGVGGAALIKVLGLNHSGRSLLITIVVGLTSAYLWKTSPYGGIANEAGIGILIGVLSNALFAPRMRHSKVG
jgi:sodium/proline symporter